MNIDANALLAEYNTQIDLLEAKAKKHRDDAIACDGAVQGLKLAQASVARELQKTSVAETAPDTSPESSGTPQAQA